MEYLEGPDQIIPCENLTTCKLDGHVKLRLTDDSFDKNIKPCSIPGTLHKIAVEYPNAIALVTTKGRGGAFKTYTYEDYEMNVRFCAKAFLKLGLKRHHSVCILGFNSPEWFFSKLGAIYAGGIGTGIYATNSAESCFHVAITSKANIIVVEDDTQLQKILAIRHRLPELKAIIQYSEEPKHPDVMAWDDLIELGSKEPDEELEKVMKTIAINECCILIYTSGTIGQPKGVMLNHDNVVFTAEAIAERINAQKGKEVVVSYLPLSHIAAQIVDIYLFLQIAGTVYFADKNALKGSLVKTLQLARPTKFLGVPRVWEKFRENITQVGAQSGYIKKQIASWAKLKGLEYNTNKLVGTERNSWGYYLASKLVFNKVKSVLGLDRCTVFVSGAAPLSVDVKKFFLSLDIIVGDAFGMSEAPCHTIAEIYQMNLASIGRSLRGFQTKIAPLEGLEEGELCVFGRHVFMGYANEPDKTKETIDDDGWLHTGDVAMMDNEDRIFITGRIKEILITAGGENIAPVGIEYRVKEEMPFVSNVIIIGEKQKFLSLLITLRTEVDLETQIPTDKLMKDVEKWLRDLGSEATTVTEVLEEGPHPKVAAAIQKAIDKANEKAISNAQKIQKYAILPKDLSISGGELGPTMKLKRNVISEKYKEIIDKFYS